MFIVFLRFASQKERAGQFAQDHKRWIQQGLDEGVFLLVGSLQPQAGGFILAQGSSPEELRARVQQDPFVLQEVVTAEVHGITPALAQDRLAFLIEASR